MPRSAHLFNGRVLVGGGPGTPFGPLAGDLALYTGSSIFAVVTYQLSTLTPHRAWGAFAAWGYAAAAVVVLTQMLSARVRIRRPRTGFATGLRARAGLTGITWAVTTVVPLTSLAIARANGGSGQAQSEVLVIEESGQRVLSSGTPYLDHAAIAALHPHNLALGYTPYHPGMAAFGIPRALLTTAWWTDARVWFAGVTIVVLLCMVSSVFEHLSPTLIRAIQAATVLPTCALALVTGGDDLPVLALCLLGFGLCARGRFGAAGLAIGAAGSLKLLAIPVALVLCAVAASKGRSAARRYAAGAFGLPLCALLPAVLVNAGAAAENVLRFPLGLGETSTPANSPLPGQLIAEALPGGRLVSLGLVVALGVVLVFWIVLSPPKSASSAAWMCAIGLTCAIVLLPSTRFGYFLYPVAYAFIAPALRPWTPVAVRARPVETEVSAACLAS